MQSDNLHPMGLLMEAFEKGYSDSDKKASNKIDDVFDYLEDYDIVIGQGTDNEIINVYKFDKRGRLIIGWNPDDSARNNLREFMSGADWKLADTSDFRFYRRLIPMNLR